jgi:cytochrome oxidase Cu insertion factor (SCO1/SenC/PrrC family)
MIRLAALGSMLVLGALGAAGCRSQASKPEPLEDFGGVADFVFVNQAGREVSRADLLGRVWIASFVFTRCNTVCPQVCGIMQGLQKDFEKRPDVKLVSFSVDPDHDKPDVLKAFAERFGADPKRWFFLTGGHEQMYQLIRGSFHLGVEQTPEAQKTAGNEVTHSTKLALVDRRARIRGYFDGAPESSGEAAAGVLARLREAVTKLEQEKP